LFAVHAESYVMNQESRGAWKELLASFAADLTPWLIVPRDPIAGDQHQVVTRSELSRDVARIAAALRRLGELPGSRVVVVAANDAECCVLLVALIAAGYVVVPIAPAARAARSGRRTWLEDVARDCGARLALTSRAVIASGGIGAAPEWLSIYSFDMLTAVEGSIADLEEPLMTEAALIQYTSGTTQSPRGALLTHANIFANLDGIQARIRLENGERALCWLPLFHDMGLIGTLLSSTWWRISMVLMTPEGFVVRPESWLWAISRFSVASCAAPNSAYHLCATRLSDDRLKGLDLSSWRFAFNGSELIQPSTLDAFYQRFSPYGFRAETMYPVYGLADNTVAATLPLPGQRPRIDEIDRDILQIEGRALPRIEGGQCFVGVGTPIEGHALRVVEPARRAALQDRCVGEIELRGPCVMQGYYRRDSETAHVLGPDGWLRTGDLGYLADGELFVVGRAKDVIKVRGRSYFASDVASVASKVEGARRSGIAVFGVPDSSTGTEALYVIIETKLQGNTQRAELERNVELVLQREVGLQPRAVIVVEPGWVPKTSSGKVKHAAARARLFETRGASNQA
jgi:fatty-acyl-CoA synthase